MVPRNAVLVLATLTAAVAAPRAACQTVRLDPVADATVRSDQPTTNAGTSTELGLAKDKNPSNAIYFMRTFFRFDVSSLAGKPIRSAELFFYEERTIAAGGLPVDVYRLTQPFVETTVTWATRPADDGQSVASVKVGDNFNRGWKQFDITILVRAWSQGTANQGCVIRLAQESTAGAYRPAWGPSREHATQNLRPYLLVDTSAAVTFGRGCGPVATWPRLALTQGTPKIGTTLTVEGSLLAVSTLSITAIGLSNETWNGIPLPLMLDPTPFPPCQLLVAPDLLLGGRTDAAGRISQVFAVPNDPTIRGVHVFLQMATLGALSHLTDGLDLLVH